MNSVTEIRDVLVVDNGPVALAAFALVVNSTLNDHVTVTASEWTTRIEHTAGDVPFELWGSGTQALWRLLSAMAYSGETVSLYEVAARCDRRNRRAVAEALAALFGDDA